MTAESDRRTFLRGIAAAVVGALALDATSAQAMRLARSVAETSPMKAGERTRSYAIPSTDSVQVDGANEVVIARFQGRVYAFSLRCPHRGTRLEWRPSEGCLYCPKHKARFARDGQHLSGRQSRDLDRYNLTREGSAIVVQLDTLLQQDEDPDAWRDAVITLN